MKTEYADEIMPELMWKAREMMKERTEIEQDLIYYIASLSDVERYALILGYESFRGKEQLDG